MSILSGVRGSSVWGFFAEYEVRGVGVLWGNLRIINYSHKYTQDFNRHLQGLSLSCLMSCEMI